MTMMISMFRTHDSSSERKIKLFISYKDNTSYWNLKLLNQEKSSVNLFERKCIPMVM